jgi:hypothetical protein
VPECRPCPPQDVRGHRQEAARAQELRRAGLVGESSPALTARSGERSFRSASAHFPTSCRYLSCFAAESRGQQEEGCSRLLKRALHHVLVKSPKWRRRGGAWAPGPVPGPFFFCCLSANSTSSVGCQ